MVSGIPNKHAQSLQRQHSLAFGCGTFAHAKDQASLPLDGMLKENPTPFSRKLSGLVHRIGTFSPNSELITQN
jgi:hypothetical protein